eukprot:scaffold82559_cov29-Tisochrysis_lutea.AAC.1
MMPKISQTEQVSLGCGTVGFDRDIFSGSPSLQTLIDKYEPRLSEEERRFLDNEVDVLCRMLDDHKVNSPPPPPRSRPSPLPLFLQILSRSNLRLPARLRATAIRLIYATPLGRLCHTNADHHREGHAP